MKAFNVFYCLVGALAGTGSAQLEPQFPVCRCTGPESNLRCRTLAFSTAAQARHAVKKTRPRGYAARGDCASTATTFECCESSKTIRVAAPNVVRRVRAASVTLGRCVFQSRRRPVCQCTGPESSLECSTVVLPTADQAEEAVNNANGTATLGECEARSTRFKCCKKVSETQLRDIVVPAPVVARRVKQESVSLGACNSTTGNSTDQ